MRMDDSAGERDRLEIGRFFNATQQRMDTWSHLRYLTEALTDPGAVPGVTRRLREQIGRDLALLAPIESYWAFPGVQVFKRIGSLLERGDDAGLQRLVLRTVRTLVGGTYRRRPVSLLGGDDTEPETVAKRPSDLPSEEEAKIERPYFEVLIVDPVSEGEEERLRDGLRGMRRAEDRFVYDVVVVPSLEDAVLAVLVNPTIQTCVIHHGFRRESEKEPGLVRRCLERIDRIVEEAAGAAGSDEDENPSVRLARIIDELRPEIDCFLVTDLSVEAVAGHTPRNVRRVFYHTEDWLELHLNILRAVNDRYKTPFFTALRDYSVQPTGVFHALPISRGKSITRSHWIQDMAQFYGMNIFLAETSATSGGLDSLLDPQGPIKRAQERAARAFGAQRTYFVTNGTSTANKVVLQGLVQPGDIVLVDRNCHKSHHYGLVLTGAQVCYLDSYPLHAYGLYGAVPLAELKRTLLAYRDAGLLDRVRMLLLTNCTFDGIAYNVERVMEECLAIKPDLIFLWDEAWFAFACCSPMYRQRSAMAVARRLQRRYASPSYRERYAARREAAAQGGAPDATARPMPDPDRVRIRVYSTQSTHKTLTALRQGSMIHVYDQDFAGQAEEPFQEAFMTHTSTSPNYQIVASLDVGRRQVELEGYELVQKQTEMAMVLRERVASHPLISRYFRFLTQEDLVPSEYRRTAPAEGHDKDRGYAPMMEAWARDELVLDPCRLTLFIGATGIDGNTFKTQYLMQKHGIQINKTSPNTVLFMTNIGTTRSSVAYLIDVLVRIARELQETEENSNRVEKERQRQHVETLTNGYPPLPEFSGFHEVFRGAPDTDLPHGDIRAAYFLAGREENCEHLRLEELDCALTSGRSIVAAKFIIPYPPGFPLLVPGQVLTPAIAAFLRRIDVREIHGYEPEMGLRVFRDSVLAAYQPAQGRNRVAPASR